ncbi:NAD(P)-dependent dehydrogenase, short-chain alcohol dehydrogenase family [Flavobacterium glycines]|uniref:NAD(P)-dependent dehydrogenase, short-chain alcohol dehydrogenase family n=1 Tax=Flavobacterium glycines TaxID=551990 RepID=A0A1B9DGY1_9FLAO|nr:SDR family NAD(P)-dependent oxidoreductase [Flavobacterium glycines]OCB68935.1 oxidoreductase [Flavobacterium glycines]GEL11129.1 oxidoreductase [Flavobacterium glycines]SDJ27609.1 NAD(P)-dependent dehydrogenase, short-chain alcohol dehydrogenase family [Flavobacterium glycines]
MGQNNYNGALQKPIGSGFNATSTTTDVIKGIDLAEKIAIVTGGDGGLGLEITKTLTSAGARVIVPARDVEKTKQNLEGINNVEVSALNLTDPASINAFAEKFLASGRPLHLLINNAGVMWTPLYRDERGNEGQFSTNHLGHFQLTAKLWEALKKANGARVITVSSSGHHYSPVLFDDVNYNTREYDKFEAYGQSKTANVLFAVELDKRALQFGVRAYALHPGLILETNLGRHLAFEDFVTLGILNADGTPNPLAEEAMKKIQKTKEQGAATTVWAATSPKLENIGGVYLEDVEIAQYDAENYDSIAAAYRNPGGFGGVAPFALDAEAAQKLWTLTEELTNTKFDI